MDFCKPGVLLVLLVWPSLEAPAASPRADAEALYAALPALLPTLPVLTLTQASDGRGRALSKTVRRSDGLSLSLFAADLADADRAAVRAQFASLADRTLAPLLLTLPRVTPASPAAPGVVELRIALGGGAQLLMSWPSDQPFDRRSDAIVRAPCDQHIAAWDHGSIPAAAAALEGLYRRQVWVADSAGQRFQRISEWQLRETRAGHAWIPTQDRCLPVAGTSPPPH